MGARVEKRRIPVCSAKPSGTTSAPAEADQDRAADPASELAAA